MVPLSVLIPTKNEAQNLPRCLQALSGWANEIVVIDSGSTDGTQDIAKSFGAKVIQFEYRGGWPKKRQWALENFPFSNEWILLLDADELLDDPIKKEIGEAIRSPYFDGYWLRYRIYFLGRQLRWGGSELWKLSLFRLGKGRFERRLLVDQDPSMGDMEVHEHVVVDGLVSRLKNPVRHENFNSIYRYIEKHNQYSNWEARVIAAGAQGEVRPKLFGNQAERRRWLKRHFVNMPGSPLALFLLKYVFQLGFLDGIPGLIYCAFQAIQLFHTKVKIRELRLLETKGSLKTSSTGVGGVEEGD